MAHSERCFPPLQDAPITAQQQQQIWREVEGMLRAVISATTSREDIDGGGVYVGLAGLALTLDHVARHLEDEGVVPQGCQPLGIMADACRSLAKAAVSNAKMDFPSKALSKRVTFLEGYSGLLALSIIQQHHTPGGHVVVSDLIQELQLMYQDRVRTLPAGECEVLYGRAGFLYSLLLVRHHLQDTTPAAIKNMIQELVRDILTAGETGAKTSTTAEKFGLIYSWHGKQYLGAAHGVVGIVHTLLHCLTEVQQALSEERGVRLVADACGALADCAAVVGGNLPSSLGSQHDRLVQWCHGAPGLVSLMCQSHKVLGDPNGIYLKVAQLAADVIWKRGLLTKGVGLCHGISGNGYAFLDLYRATNEEKYLDRAQQFAHFVACNWRELYERPDRPASLYEGVAGAVCFVFDALKPESAHFPGYQLPSE